MEQLTDDERAKLREMIDTWDSAQTGVRIVVGIGTVVKWIAGVIAAAAVVWAALRHGGDLPK